MSEPVPRCNLLTFPTDVVLLVVRWRLRYKLSLRDLAEMFLDRGIVFTHEAVRDWEARFGPLITQRLRRIRRGQAGPSWYVDETYLKVAGRWCYLYRAVDRDGNLVDCRLSETRDMEAARAFFRRALDVVEKGPDRVTSDAHGSYPRAILEELGDTVLHRVNAHLINFTEQSHRPIKQRYYPMRGFGAFSSASRFCSAFEELRDFYRPGPSRAPAIPLSEQRRIHRERTALLNLLLVAA